MKFPINIAYLFVWNFLPIASLRPTAQIETKDFSDILERWSAFDAQSMESVRKQTNTRESKPTSHRLLWQKTALWNERSFPLTQSDFLVPDPMRANNHSKPSLINDLILIIIQVVTAAVWELSYHQRKHCCFPLLTLAVLLPLTVNKWQKVYFKSPLYQDDCRIDCRRQTTTFLCTTMKTDCRRVSQVSLPVISWRAMMAWVFADTTHKSWCSTVEGTVRRALTIEGHSLSQDELWCQWIGNELW